MQIQPKQLARSYYSNWRAELAICDILQFLDIVITDHLGKYRSEYDYQMNKVMTEQKITASYDISVETHKDANRSVPSGLLVSQAPLVVVLSRGGSDVLNPIGKLRVFYRNILLQAASKRTGKFWPGATESQGAYVVPVPCRRDDHLPHLWLGDMQATAVNGNIVHYDTETFCENPYARKELHNLFDALAIGCEDKQ